MSLYDFAISLLPIAVRTLALFKEKERKLWHGQQQLFEQLRCQIDSSAHYIWFHAASLGEFEQGRPLMERIRREEPQLKIIVTFFSPSGYEVRKNWEGADIVCYLPFDTKSNVRQFLDLVKPVKVIFIKYEFWRNYLNELHVRQIPTYLISAIFRPEHYFFRPLGRGWYLKLLRRFDHLFVQDEESAHLLQQVGIKNFTVCGDTRFDRVVDIQQVAKAISLVEVFSRGQKVLVVGSSWPQDEAILLDWFNRKPELKLIIAPHEIHEAHIQQILSLLQRPVLRYTEATPELLREADCLIMDCFGMLSSVYRYGQVAYLGGGFGTGIHNVLEAAVYGMPVIWGPTFHKFREAKELLACGGGFSINSAAQFEEVADQLFANPTLLQQAGGAAGEYVHGNAGATEAIYTMLFLSNC